MKIIKKLCHKNEYVTAVALGLFDGVHLGHKKVIDMAVKNKNYKSAVLTFTTKKDRPTKKLQQKDILTVNQRLSCLESLNVDYVYIPDFDDIKNLTPKQFINNILQDVINAKIIYCGQDFRFGKNAVGDVTLLNKICKDIGIEVFVVGQEYYKDEVISATNIRKFIQQGQIDKANELLGYNYFIEEVVKHGYHIGRTIKFPTINQELSENICLPKFGVYISSVDINGKMYKSITNIGVKPTITGKRKPLAETHIIDFNGDLYGQKLKVKLYKFVRIERKFDSIDGLKKEISQDALKSIRYFQKGIDK